MKAYVIYLPKSKLSTDSANTTIQTGKDIGKIDVELWEGFDKFTGPIKHKETGYPEHRDAMSWGYSDVDAAIGTFYSHHSLWEECVRTNQHILILEHDAYFTKQVTLMKTDGVVNIGEPQRGAHDVAKATIDKVKANTPNWKKAHRFNPILDTSNYDNMKWRFKTRLRSNYGLGFNTIRICCLFGAHAYIMSPTAATILLKKAKEYGIMPADLFVQSFGAEPYNIKIEDLVPFSASEKSSFSMIQNKHHPFLRKGQKWENKTKTAETAWEDYGKT